MEIFDDVVAAIGNTPLIRLGRIHEPGNLVAKVEYMNPGGSTKERIAVSMIDAAIELAGSLSGARVHISITPLFGSNASATRLIEPGTSIAG